MNNERLLQLEENLALLHEQQAGLEREAILVSGQAKIQAFQRLKTDILPEIKKYEKEYWSILSQSSESIESSEQEAEAIIVEIIDKVDGIELADSSYPDEVLTILREIRDKLNKPGVPAAAKLKGVISSIPPFLGVSYEAEIDTENFLKANFPTFVSFIKKVVKKNS
jgi:hypothetical protein